MNERQFRNVYKKAMMKKGIEQTIFAREILSEKKGPPPNILSATKIATLPF